MNTNWQKAFNHMTTGLYVLTTCHEKKINGMIVSWASQASYNPPMIMVAVHPRRYSHQLIEKSKHFALHAVENTQDQLIDRMMGPEPAAKFLDLTWQTSQTGCPLFDDCLAWFECRVIEQHRPGNHTLFVGQVINAKRIAHGKPFSTQDYESVYIGST